MLLLLLLAGCLLQREMEWLLLLPHASRHAKQHSTHGCSNCRARRSRRYAAASERPLHTTTCTHRSRRLLLLLLLLVMQRKCSIDLRTVRNSIHGRAALLLLLLVSCQSCSGSCSSSLMCSSCLLL
jgi:hypothetical protein